jgi:hypothetical protein
MNNILKLFLVPATSSMALAQTETETALSVAVITTIIAPRNNTF